MLSNILLALAVLSAPVDDHPFETDETRTPSIETGGSALIQGATIHSAVGPAFVGDVLVVDGKIAAVGESLDAPDGVETLEAGGMHLAPGVVDCHSHMAIERGVNEGTLTITAEVTMKDVVNPDDPGIYRALAGGVTTIRLLHGSANAIGGRDEVLKLKWHVTEDELRFPGSEQGIKFALGENPKRSNGSRRGTPRYPATRMGVESVYYRAFERAREYKAEWASYEAERDRGLDPAPPRRDIRLEVLQGILDGDVMIHSHCYRADEMLMLIRVADEFGFTIATLQHVLEGYKVAWEMAQAGVGGSAFSDWWAYKVEAYDAIPQCAALMHDAGVLSSINSDSGEMIRRLYEEAAKSVRYAGMDRVEALKLVTLNPAIQLGIGERVGSIEVGKDADMALLDGDPLSSLSRVEWTMVDGEMEFTRVDAFGLDSDPPQVAEVPTLKREFELVGPVTALVGGTVHPVSGEAIEDGTVLMQAGHILDVGAGLPLPEDATVHDVTGLHVWPGMISLNSKLGLQEISAVRSTDDRNEVGGNQPDLRVSASLHADSAKIGVTRHNGITRAQVVPGGGPVRGQSAIIRLSGLTWEELTTHDRDMLHVSFPRYSNSDKDRAEISDDEQELRDVFERARAYGDLVDGASDGSYPAPPHDPRLAALVEFARGQKPVGLHADGAQQILAALRFADELELNAVLYGARDAWKVAARLAEHDIPVVIGSVWRTPSGYDPYDAPYANAAVLARAGVRFAITTSDEDNERNLPFQAATAAAYGLPLLEAVRAVTLYPAHVLGLDGELGSLSPGKIADVVVTRGHLLEIDAPVEHLFIDGERVDHRDDKQSKLYERYKRRLEEKRSER